MHVGMEWAGEKGGREMFLLSSVSVRRERGSSPCCPGLFLKTLFFLVIHFAFAMDSLWIAV